MNEAERRAERDKLVGLMTEAIVAALHAIQGDPDEDGSPFGIGLTLAHTALAAIESAGFTVEKRRPA